MAGPRDVVNRQKWLIGNGCGRYTGERYDVPMQVGLVGVAAVGCDPGGVLPGDQAVGGLVEADQLRSALGWQAPRASTGDHLRTILVARRRIRRLC